VFDKESAIRCLSILKREDTTSEADFRTPYFREYEREDAVSFLDDIYNPEGWVTLTEDYKRVLDDFEMGQREKISPMSPYKRYREDGPTKVEKILSDKGLEVDDGLLNRAMKMVLEWIRPDALIARIPTKQAILGSQGEGATPGDFQGEGMDLSTNAGPPFYGPWYPRESLDAQRRQQGKIAFEHITNVMVPEGMSAVLKGDPVEVWAMVFKRLAQSKDPSKRKRIVIGPAKFWPIIGKTLSYPFIQEVKTKYLNDVRIFSALTNPLEIARDMQMILKNAASTGNIVVSGDLANYDATIPPRMIELAAEVMSECFEDSLMMRTMGIVLANHYNIITPTKVYLSRPSSMKSGDPFTNLFDSIILLIVLAYGSLKYGYDIINVSVQGDDFVVMGPGVNPEVIEKVFDEFGLSANSSKQLYEEGALSFLQNLHFLGIEGGIGSCYRVFGRNLSYERMRYKGKDYSGKVDVVATIGRLETLWNHPQLEDVVNLIADYDKYALGRDRPAYELLERTGDVGREVLQQDSVAWKTGGEVDGFSNMVVNGVLRGELLPPQGSEARLLRALGHLEG
jgi:hypothetical protein